MAQEEPAEDESLKGPRRRAGTSTSSFGVSKREGHDAVPYTHLRAHATVLDLVCRLLPDKKNSYTQLAAHHTVLYLVMRHLLYEQFTET